MPNIQGRHGPESPTRCGKLNCVPLEGVLHHEPWAATEGQKQPKKQTGSTLCKAFGPQWPSWISFHKSYSPHNRTRRPGWLTTSYCSWPAQLPDPLRPHPLSTSLVKLSLSLGHSFWQREEFVTVIFHRLVPWNRSFWKRLAFPFCLGSSKSWH